MKRFFTLLTLFAILCTTILPLQIQAAATSGTNTADTQPEPVPFPKGPAIKAKSAIVMDANSGAILYEKNSRSKNYPASTTKLMTVLLALENASLNETVTFSHDAVYGIEPGSSNIGAMEGEKIRMEDCLYGIMLFSANEASNAVAEHISGDTKSFIKKMNERAKELGCLNTNFVNPHGLFNKNHYTSSYDLALISKELLKHPSFRKITSTKNYVLPKSNKRKAQDLYNHHKMLRNTSFYYEGCFGGKTGYTEKARYNLATFAKRDNLELICIVMNDDVLNDHYKDTEKLLNFTYQHFKAYPASTTTNTKLVKGLFNTFNPLFQEELFPLSLSKNNYIVLPNSAQISQTDKRIEIVPRSTSNDTIGKIHYSYNGKEIGTSNILYQDNSDNNPVLSTPKIKYKSSSIETIFKNIQWDWKIVLLLSIIVIVLLIILIYYFFIERPHRKRRKAFYDKRRRHLSKRDFMHF